MFLWLPYFSPKSFGFFYIRLLVCFRVTPSQLLIEFSHSLPIVDIIVIIIIYPLEIFTSALADDFSLESEWYQVFSSLQDSSQYSDRCQWCSSLDGLHLSANFQVLQSL